MITQTAAIIVLFAGVCAALVYSYFSKKITGDFLRALDALGADGENTAKAIEELGFGRFKSAYIRMSLGKGSVLRRFVDTAVKPENTSGDADEEKDDVQDNIPGQLYFIKPEKHDEVLRRYKKDTTSLPVLILCIILLLAAAFVCTVVYPYLRNATEGIFDGAENEITENQQITDEYESGTNDDITGIPEVETDSENTEIPEIIFDDEKGGNTQKEQSGNRFETA